MPWVLRKNLALTLSIYYTVHVFVNLAHLFVVKCLHVCLRVSVLITTVNQLESINVTCTS